MANEILPQLVYSLGEQNVRDARHCGYCSQLLPDTPLHTSGMPLKQLHSIQTS